MSDTITLDFLGKTLRQIQADQRTLRMENELLRKELGRFSGGVATREELSEVPRVIVDRIANFEALMEVRFDRLDAKP
jgi:hypothetical protein